MWKRSMIVVNRAGVPVLEGRELKPGERLEIRLAGAGGPVWYPVCLVRVRGVWALHLRSGVALGAVGQLARFPLVTKDPATRYTILRLRRCKYRCPRRFDREACATSCPLFWEKERLLKDENTPPEIRKLCT